MPPKGKGKAQAKATGTGAGAGAGEGKGKVKAKSKEAADAPPSKKARRDAHAPAEEPVAEELVGRQVAKHFEGHGVFNGTITRVDKYVHVRYDDGDEEDLEEHEVDKGLRVRSMGVRVRVRMG